MCPLVDGLTSSNTKATTIINLTGLPTELLDRTFSCLSRDQPSVSASRLTCRYLSEISSPHLIPHVVFAKRLPELTFLRQVFDHEYFRRHVTHIVYDTNTFSSELDDEEWYETACRFAPRHPDTFRDWNWIRALDADRSNLQGLLTDPAPVSPVPGLLSARGSDWLDATSIQRHEISASYQRYRRCLWIQDQLKHDSSSLLYCRMRFVGCRS